MIWINYRIWINFVYLFTTWYFIQSVTSQYIQFVLQCWLTATIQTVCIAKSWEIWVRPTIQTVCIAAAHSRAQYKPIVSQEARGFKLPYLLNKHPFFYQNTDIGWTGTRILTIDFIILCLFSGGKWRQQTRKPLGVRTAYISWIVREFSPPPPPHTSYLGTKKYPTFTKSRTCRGLK